jgi:uncharacterized protein (TIGR03083 family)
MHTHDEAWDVLGAWVLDACDADVAEQVATHVAGCAQCRAEADRLRAAAEWIGVADPVAPGPELRDRLLAAAHAVRPPGRPGLRAMLAGYREQVAELSTLLGALDAGGLSLGIPRHGTIQGLVEHLAGNDRVVLTAVEPAAPAPAGWREQADLLADLCDAAGAQALDPLVPLAGPTGTLRPVRAALAQRVFETWTHAEDVRVALRQPYRPPRPTDIETIIALGTDLLPEALFRLGRAHPGQAARLVLTGSGGRRWMVPLATGSATSLACAVVVDAVDFCRLMAGRLSPGELPHAVDGETKPAADLLFAASTLGCD